MEQYQKYIEVSKRILGDAFTECEAKDVGTNPLEELDVFCWCEEVYIVQRSGGHSAVVRAVDGSLASSKWYWSYEGEHNVKIGTITQEKMDSFITPTEAVV